MGNVYMCIDLKSFYASVECVARGYDPIFFCMHQSLTVYIYHIMKKGYAHSHSLFKMHSKNRKPLLDLHLQPFLCRSYLMVQTDLKSTHRYLYIFLFHS